MQHIATPILPLFLPQTWLPFVRKGNVLTILPSPKTQK
jgi:hypothetical protein